MAGGLHPDHDQLRVDLDSCLIQQAAQLTQADAVSRQLGPVDDHAAVQVAAEHKPARLGDVDADQQHPSGVKVTDQLPKRRGALSTDVQLVASHPILLGSAFR